MKTPQQEDTVTLVRTIRGLFRDRMIAQGQCFKDLTAAITEISLELARRGYYDPPSLTAELVTLIERCRQLEKIFPQQAGLIRAMTKEAREAMALSVQTEKSEAD